MSTLQPAFLQMTIPSLLVGLFLSLILTLLLELTFARLWGEPASSLSAVVVVNVISNPIVVLLHRVCLLHFPSLIVPATAILELGAVLGEGWYYRRHTSIHYPWGFSLCANLFSFCIGLLITVWRSFQ